MQRASPLTRLVATGLAQKATTDLYSALSKGVDRMTGKSKKGSYAKKDSKAKYGPIRAVDNIYTPSSLRITKSHEASDVNRWFDTGLNFQTLSKHAVPFPPARVGATDLNYTYNNGLREGPRIHAKGIKLWFDIHSLSIDDIEVHLALIQKTAVGTALLEIEGDFFTNHVVGENQAEDFVSQTATYDETQRYSSINSERYRVLMHRKFMMGAENFHPISDPITNPQNTSNKQWNNKITFEKYFKLNQIMEFDSHTSQSPKRPFVMLCWVCPRRSEGLATNAQVSFSSRMQVYYSELR